MAFYLGKERSKEEILSYVGDPRQIAGARSCALSDGKADGLRAVEVTNGGGLAFTVLPGRGMDIPFASYKGRSLNYFSGTGIASPAYYEEPGFGWLRNFFCGLLTTCGLTNAGFPSSDEGKAYGLHGRISNAGAEDLCVRQEWKGDEYLITVSGTVREASAMNEFMTLTRSVETSLGSKRIVVRDLVENRGFEPQPLMMLYHFNFGHPLLGPRARIVAPIKATSPRDDESARDRGVEECRTFPEPRQSYKEKVFFHELGATREGRTLVALLNPDIGDGTPLGIVMRYSLKELPKFLEWKMPSKGCYVAGLEPGTVTCLGRGPERERGQVPCLAPQSSYPVEVELSVVDSLREFDELEREAAELGRA